MAIVTWIGHAVIPTDAETVAFAYLLLVLSIAMTWGFFESALSSIVSTIAFNFVFLEPKFTLTIVEPTNGVALFAFLATSLTTSRLSALAKSRATDAIERQKDLERLYTFSRALLLAHNNDPNEPFAKQLAMRLADSFELTAAALYDSRSGEIYRAGATVEWADDRLRAAALHGADYVDAERRCVITAIRVGSEPLAGLGLWGGRMSDSVRQSMTNLVTIALDRSRAQDLALEVEAERRSEQLRTTLIDAIAHELKTPLTSIRAVTTALMSNAGQIPARAASMLQIADDEAARLQDLIDNALDVAHLDHEHIDVELEMSDIFGLVREVISSTNAGDRELELILSGAMQPIHIDRRLIKLAIRQILDNAMKYSPANTPVTIRLSRNADAVVLEMTDRGKGISEQEQKRIFERFYRSPSVRGQIPGTGLGLSIAHRIMQAHGGDLTVASRPGETTFRLVLRVQGEGEVEHSENSYCR